MIKRLRFTIIFIVFFFIIIYGLIAVSSNLPKFIKDSSMIKVSVTKKPFQLEFDIGDYVVYINNKPFVKIKERTEAIFKSINP